VACLGSEAVLRASGKGAILPQSVTHCNTRKGYITGKNGLFLRSQMPLEEGTFLDGIQSIDFTVCTIRTPVIGGANALFAERCDQFPDNVVFLVGSRGKSIIFFIHRLDHS